MAMVSIDKKRGKKRLINSFKYAFEGIKTALKKEQNMFIHCVACILVIILGLILKISSFEWLVCFILFGLVIATELINTSIEATIDLITKETKIEAKIAKDTASGAVLIFALVAFISGLIIFIPKIINLF